MSGKESQSKKNHSLNTSRDKLQHSQNVHFNDKRPEAVVQQKTQQMADQFTNGLIDPIQKKKNKTGLPDKLKSGIENLSGHSMDDVKVHYNSSKPTQLNAHAYAQGTNIHVASGQEKHLPHEAWHVAQQKQGRVKPTKQLKSGVAINDDKGLEKEADVMGARAKTYYPNTNSTKDQQKDVKSTIQKKTNTLIQRQLKIGKLRLDKVNLKSPGLEKALNEKGVTNVKLVVALLNDRAENKKGSFNSWDAAIQWALKRIKLIEERQKTKARKSKKGSKSIRSSGSSETELEEKEMDSAIVTPKKKKVKFPVFRPNKTHIDFDAGENEANKKEITEQLRVHFEGELEPTQDLVETVLKLLLQIPAAKGSEANEKSSKGHISQEPKILAQIKIVVFNFETIRLKKKFGKSKVRKVKDHLNFKATEKGDTHGTQEQ
ncbi:hypothetical protein C5O00_00070 [Pukyongia salina]|uniref:eCIS core domain-containing protein n=2 Tax=Pukyongia salina TaxID=2094025 RepID=A0A2S0HTZ6_9FLAO|nr:hypothetical protein C5O00_00070 [Pukyongia salina]